MHWSISIYQASDILQRDTCKLSCTELHKAFPFKTHLKEEEEQWHRFMWWPVWHVGRRRPLLCLLLSLQRSTSVALASMLNHKTIDLSRPGGKQLPAMSCLAKSNSPQPCSWTPGPSNTQWPIPMPVKPYSVNPVLTGWWCPSCVPGMIPGLLNTLALSENQETPN